MHLNENREVGLGGTFSRQAVVSLLVFGAIWEVLSYFAPALGIPAFAIPSFARIGQSLMSITATDVVVTVARVIGALILSFILGVVLAMAMYRSERLESYLFPIIRLFMAVPVVSWILFAVLWFRGVEFRITFWSTRSMPCAECRVTFGAWCARSGRRRCSISPS
jgi:NitT/TauT family transport system permease protein